MQQKTLHNMSNPKAIMASNHQVHHLQINRNDMLVSGIKPHLYCLPGRRREEHRLALRRRQPGDKKFFLGTDTAPHGIGTGKFLWLCRHVRCSHALENYVQVFDEENTLDKFEAFASLLARRSITSRSMKRKRLR